MNARAAVSRGSSWQKAPAGSTFQVVASHRRASRVETGATSVACSRGPKQCTDRPHGHQVRARCREPSLFEQTPVVCVLRQLDAPVRSGIAQNTKTRGRNSIRAQLGHNASLLLGLLVTAAALSSICQPVHAQSAPDLKWDAPDSCPNRASLVGALEQQLRRGNRTQLLSNRAWSAQAAITQQASGYKLSISIHVGDKLVRRELSHSSCPTLRDAAALFIALALLETMEPAEPPREAATVPAVRPLDQPEASASPALSASAAAAGSTPESTKASAATERLRPEAPQTQDPSPEVSSQSTPEPRQRQSSTPSAERRDEPAGRGHSDASTGPLPLKFGVVAALQLGFGAVPSDIPLRAYGALELAYARTRIAVGAGWWLAATQRSPAYPPALVDSRGWSANLRLSQDFLWTRLILSPLVGLEYSQATLSTREVATPARHSASWWAVGAGLQARYELLPHVWALLDGWALWPTTRTRWVFRAPQGNVALYTSAPLMLQLSAGVAYVFE